MNPKMETLLQVSLAATQAEREKSGELGAGYQKEEKTWELIIKYNGNISDLQQKYPQIRIFPLLNQYATLIVPQSIIALLSYEVEVELLEKPKRLYFDLQTGKQDVCVLPLQLEGQNVQSLYGKGVVVAIIDSGIQAQNHEFRNDDGSTRILEIWDQQTDRLMTKEEINQCLKEKREKEIVGRDTIGHGTKVATIACGKSGMASQSDILVVKLRISPKESFPRTTQLMQAIDYVIRKGMVWKKPVAINISFGNNYGDHRGNSLLERYISDVSLNGKTTICIGTGNEGLGATHTSGMVKEYDTQTVECNVGSYETSLDIQFWKEYWDDMALEIETPTGKYLGTINSHNQIQRAVADDTLLLLYGGDATPYSSRQEYYMDFIPKRKYIAEGTWRIHIQSGRVRSGRYDMWLPGLAAINKDTQFVAPDHEISCTIPGTANHIIAVGAYDARTDTVASFSGRGYQGNIGEIPLYKPDIVAPGVEVFVDSGSSCSGTSCATPFVTGAAALLMEWGIINGNDPYLYGEKVRACLIKGARRLPGYEKWPNVQAGYGAICVSASLPK